ncbi:hypothetical protein QTV49_001695 [Vibrio vulnificus]|nr:hypothetical protein [Vibrio vulnificus]
MRKNLVGAFLALIVLLQTPLTYAGDKISISVTCPVEVEELYEPISSRVFLAMFGPEGSIRSFYNADLSDKQKDVISSMTVSERAACAAPMPVETANTIANTLRYLYVVTGVLWLVMFSIYAFDSSYLSQNRNTEKSASKESPAITILRSILVVAITLPFLDWIVSPFTDKDEALKEKGESSVYDYSALHQLMFIGVGKAISVAEDIDQKLKQRYVSSNPIYVIPDPDYPQDTGAKGIMSVDSNKVSAILDFGLCVAFETNGITPNFNDIVESVTKDDNNYKLRFSYTKGKADCALDIQMKKDLETLKAVESLTGDKDLGFSMDYMPLESRIFTSLARTLVDVSVGYAEGLLSTVSSDSDRILLDNGNAASQGVNKDINNLRYWTEACPFSREEAKSLASQFSKPSDSYKPTQASVAEFRALSEKCIAYIVTAKLAYPKSFDGDFTSEVNPLFGVRQLKFDAAPLLDDGGNYKFSDIRNARRLSGRQYQTCSYSINSGNNNAPQECLKSVCGLVDPNAAVTGLFECAALVHVEKNASLNRYYDSLGFVATPATLLMRLGGGEIASAPQGVISSFKAEYSGSVSPEAPLYGFYKDMTNIDVSMFFPAFKVTDYGFDGVKVIQRSPFDMIFQCLVTPSRVITSKDLFGDDYFSVCEHPINEIHNFGMYLLKMYAGYLAGASFKHAQGAYDSYIEKKNKIKAASDGSLTGKNPSAVIDKPIVANKKSKNEAKAKQSPWDKALGSLLGMLASGSAIFLGGGLASIAVEGGSLTVPRFLDPFLGNNNDENPYWSDPSGSFTTASVVGGFAMGYLISGNIKIKDGSKPSKAQEQAMSMSATTTTTIGMLILTFGFIAAFIIPLVPAAIFYAAFISVLANLLAMVFSANFHVIYAFANTGSDVRKKLTILFNKWVLMMLRLPLLVVGFYLTYSLMVTVLPSFAEVSNNIITMAGLNVRLFGVVDISGFLGMLLAYFIFLIFFFILMFATFDAITGPFELTRGIVFNDDSGEALGKSDSHSKIEQNLRLFKSL